MRSSGIPCTSSVRNGTHAVTRGDWFAEFHPLRFPFWLQINPRRGAYFAWGHTPVLRLGYRSGAPRISKGHRCESRLRNRTLVVRISSAGIRPVTGCAPRVGPSLALGSFIRANPGRRCQPLSRIWGSVGRSFGGAKSALARLQFHIRSRQS